MTTPEPTRTASKPDRHRFQFSLAELLAVTTILAVGLSLLKWLHVEFGPDVFSFVIVAGVYVGFATWLFIDARTRGYSGPVVVLLFTLAGPVAILIWFFVRPKAKVVIQPPADYAHADDALAAAYQLDMDGDWNAAAALYGEIARRWSEHEHYARECLTQLEEKRSRVKQS